MGLTSVNLFMNVFITRTIRMNQFDGMNQTFNAKIEESEKVCLLLQFWHKVKLRCVSYNIMS